jgi:hypothetical protein
MSGLADFAAATTNSPDLFPLLTGIARLLGYLGFVVAVGTTFFLAWLWPADAVEWVFIRLFHGGAALCSWAPPWWPSSPPPGRSAMPSPVEPEPPPGTDVRPRPRSRLRLGNARRRRRWRIPITVRQLVLINDKKGFDPLIRGTYVFDSDAWAHPGKWSRSSPRRDTS